MTRRTEPLIQYITEQFQFFDYGNTAAINCDIQPQPVIRTEKALPNFVSETANFLPSDVDFFDTSNLKQ